MDDHNTSAPTAGPRLTVYVLPDCENCRFALETAATIQRDYPQVQVEIVDLATTREPLPATVFATPTYLLDGRVWSLGNPSAAQIRATFATSLA